MGGDSGTAETQGTGAKTLAAMVLAAEDRYDGTALKYHDGDSWTEMSYADFMTATREIAAGLIELGVEHGDRVAIFANTRAEWTLADIGTVLAAATVVPIYQTSSAEEAKHILSDSEAKYVFCENEELLNTAKEATGDLDIDTFILLEGSADGAITLDELREKGSGSEADVTERAEGVSADDIFTLVYTSGTTGPPKGCVLTHGNYRANAEMLEQVARIDEGSSVYLFLPLAHVLSRMTQMVGIDLGATLGFWRGDKDKMMDDLQEIAPTHFPAVPRIFEKIYEEARKKADGTLKEKVFEKAIQIGREVRLLERQGEEPGPVLRKEYDLADKRVLSNVRNVFGGNLDLAITGAAPVAKEMLEFFDACGVLILEGYGSTETSAVVSANSPRLQVRHRRQADAWHRGEDRHERWRRLRRRRRSRSGRRPRRDHGQGPARVPGLPQPRRRDQGGPDRGRLVQDRRPRHDRRRGLPLDRGPDEGDHRHLVGQEHHAHQHRGEDLRQRGGVAGDRVRRRAPLPGGADHARRGQRRRRRRTATRCRRPSTPPTRTSLRSSR